MAHFARSGGLLGFPELVRALGGNPAQLFASVGLSISVLQDPDLYLPYASQARLYTLAAESCREPAFGALLGSRQGLEVFGALGSCLCLQTRISDAIALVRKSLDFHARGANIDLRRGDEALELSLSLDFADQVDCDQLIAGSLALIARSLAQLHQAALPPVEVLLSVEPTGSRDSYVRAFGCPVRFGEAVNQLRYPPELIVQSVVVDQTLKERLTTQWRHGRLVNHIASLQQQVERAICALLPTGECNLDMVAGLVDRNPRSLQVSLQRSGSSFGATLQDTRFRLARQHLQQSDIDLTTLALNLGFSELATFSRAFKQWSGLSPRAWRRQNMQGAAQMSS